MNANGTNQVTLSNDPLGIVLSASWSPDGNHIVFSTVKFQVQDDNRKYYIYTMNADGTNDWLPYQKTLHPMILVLPGLRMESILYLHPKETVASLISTL